MPLSWKEFQLGAAPKTAISQLRGTAVNVDGLSANSALIFAVFVKLWCAKITFPSIYAKQMLLLLLMVMPVASQMFHQQQVLSWIRFQSDAVPWIAIDQ